MTFRNHSTPDVSVRCPDRTADCLDPLERAHRDCLDLTWALQYCLLGLTGQLNVSHACIMAIPSSNPEQGEQQLDVFRGISAGELHHDAQLAMRFLLPEACGAVCSSFGAARGDFAGLFGSIHVGQYVGASAHEVVWNIATLMQFTRLHAAERLVAEGLIKRGSDSAASDVLGKWELAAFIEMIAGLDLDELAAKLRAEFGKARRSSVRGGVQEECAGFAASVQQGRDADENENQVDVERQCVKLRGDDRKHSVTEAQAIFLSKLSERGGKWTPGKQTGVSRPDKMIKRLPEQVQAYVESAGGGKGYRLCDSWYSK
jgi:hypothetical protein